MTDETKTLLEEADSFIRVRKGALDFGAARMVERLTTLVRDEVLHSDAWRKALGAAIHEINGMREGGL